MDKDTALLKVEEARAQMLALVNNSIDSGLRKNPFFK